MSMLKSFKNLSSAQVVSEANAYVPNNSAKGVLAIFTDEVRWMTGEAFANYLKEEGRQECLLELRAHNGICEFHALRSHVKEPFVARLRTHIDAQDDDGFYVDEVQYLDIDTTAPGTRPKECRYQSIAGGRYELPVANAEKVTVRNFYQYDKRDGMARLVDFCIVCFGDQGKEGSRV